MIHPHCRDQGVNNYCVKVVGRTHNRIHVIYFPLRIRRVIVKNVTVGVYTAAGSAAALKLVFVRGVFG